MRIFAVCLYIVLLAGWGNNFAKFTECDFEAPYKCEAVRGITTFPLSPIGTVIGYMDFEFDGK